MQLKFGLPPLFLSVQRIKARGCEEDLSEASLPPSLMPTSARASSHLSDAAQIYVAEYEEANPACQAMCRLLFLLTVVCMIL